MSLPLAGVRVLDVSRVLAGPWCSQILADLGAEVIKVERPGVGDDLRAAAPPFFKKADGTDSTEGAFFCSTNRGKKSITLNLSTSEGRDIVRKIIPSCDIVLENFRAGTLAKLGLGYADLSPLNPGLIYCSISGFGQSGPYNDRPGYDFVFQAMGGLMSVTGERQDKPGGGPQKVGIAFADITTGLYSTVAILAAVASRNVSGKGQLIDIALLDVVIAALGNMNANYFASGHVPQCYGNAHSTLVPYQVFQTSDGPIVIAAGNDALYRNLCTALGREDLYSDARFATNPNRIRNRGELIPILEREIANRTAADLLKTLHEHDVPAGPINTLADVFEDPQVIHRRMKREVEHPLVGTMPIVANPIHFSETPVRYDLPPPLLGEHTRTVLAELASLDDEMLDAFASKGVI